MFFSRVQATQQPALSTIGRNHLIFFKHFFKEKASKFIDFLIWKAIWETKKYEKKLKKKTGKKFEKCEK